MALEIWLQISPLRLAFLLLVMVESVSSENITVTPTTPCSVSCEDITLSQCRDILPYTQAGFPNFLGHPSSSKASEFVNLVTILVLSNCYEYTKNFLCGVLFPECDEENNGFILPTKTMCVNFIIGCEQLLESNDGGESALEIDCRKFPEPVNTDPVCYHSLSLSTSPPESNKTRQESDSNGSKGYTKHIIVGVCLALGLSLVIGLVSLCIYYTRPKKSKNHAKSRQVEQKYQDLTNPDALKTADGYLSLGVKSRQADQEYQDVNYKPEAQREKKISPGTGTT